MNEEEITRVIKELTRLLQDMSGFEFELEAGETEERLETIRSELGSWFIDGYQLYQGS
jgi:hypothetical protein